MKNETLAWIFELEDGLKDTLKKRGFEEGRDYTLRTYPESQYNNKWYYMIDVDFNPYLYEDKKFRMKGILSRYQKKNGGRFNPLEGNDRCGLSYQLDKNQYLKMLDCEEDNNKNIGFSPNVNTTGKNSASQENSSWKRKVKEIPEADVESNSEKRDLGENDKDASVVMVQLSDSVPVKKSYCGCVRETLQNSDAHMQAIGVAAVTAAVTAGILTIKACYNTPRLEGESRLHKTKRVVKEMAKRPGTWLKIVGTSLLAYGVSIGCQAYERMGSPERN